jgi:membrane protein implicated in regulation of membrane protease activity
MAILFWLVILLVCIFAEIHTQAFVAVFVAVGSIVAFFLAMASVPFAVEAVVFVVVTAITLFTLRPSIMRRFARTEVVDLTIPAPSSLANMTGFVEDVVGDEGHPGRVKIRGESWRAVTEQATPIASGARVIVTKAYGTTLWVEPTDEAKG